MGNPAVRAPDDTWVPVALAEPKIAVPDGTGVRWVPLVSDLTWADVKDQYATWQDLIDAVDTWGAISGQLDMRFRALDGSSWWPLDFIPVPSTTQVTLDGVPALMMYQPYTVTGVVSAEKRIWGGFLTLQMRSGAGAWADLSTYTLLPEDVGHYEMSFTPSGGGAVEIRVLFDPDTEDVLEGESPSVPSVIGLPTPAKPRGIALSHSDITLAWDAVPNATQYEVLEGGTSRVVAAPTTQLYANGLANDVNYGWRVRAQIVVGGQTYSSDYSDALYSWTGHPEQRRSGNAEWQFNKAIGGSHRADTGWATGDLYQGFYSASSRNYIGCSFFDTQAIRYAINATHGDGVWENMQATGFWMHGLYHKSGVGRNASIGIHFRMLTGWAGGGPPGIAGDEVRASPAWNQWWDAIGLPADWGRQLIHGNWTGVGMEYGSANDYAAFEANDPTHGRIQVNANWNFVIVNTDPPRWG